MRQRTTYLTWLVLFLLGTCAGLLAQVQQLAPVNALREKILFDSGWRFALGNAVDPNKDFNFSTVAFFFAKAGYGDGPASPKFDDRSWRLLDLPHDWAVELPFDPAGTTNHGSKAIGHNFPQNSIGWYRKTFTIPREDQGRDLGITFDGIYRNAQVWINGFYLGTEPSGYSSVHYDLFPYLNYGGENVIVVRVDATLEEGWFYEGAGIYRHVWLTRTNPLHIAHDGTFVSSEAGDPLAAHPDAQITARARLTNDSTEDAAYILHQRIEDASGNLVAHADSQLLHLSAAATMEERTTLSVRDAHLWSLESPTLYKLVTTVESHGKLVDRYETSFGIRTLRFDPDHGFFLNGKHLQIRGTNNHQDHAGVGVALPDDLNLYRIERLKEMGSNAIRTSHHPPTPELLDACDRLGMLVLDENRAMGTSPTDFDHLQRMIERDRNHPSVILWSVGNEEWSLEWSPVGERITKAMQDFGRRLDPTRRFTVALSGSGAGNSLSTDVLGFNYYLQHHVDEIHKRFPEKPIVATEESSSEHTRGIYHDDPDHQYLVAYDFQTDGKNASVEDAWKFYQARPYSAGLFYWTGFDYRGETSPFGWPAISSQFGMLDTCGFFKDNAYLVQSWWTTKPMVHLLPHWNWAGREGQPIDVRVYSNVASIELFLNGKSLGRKAVLPDSHLEWKVNYQPGRLIARGYDAAGKEVAADTVETTGKAAELQLSANHKSIAADGRSVSVVTVRVNDGEQRNVPDANHNVAFTLTGPGHILGVGNGDPASHDPDKYLDVISNITTEDWRSLHIDLRLQGPESATEFDDSNWEKARDSRWDEPRAVPAATVFRGAFTLPITSDGDTITLYLNAVGATQSIYLNGHALATNRLYDAKGFSFIVDHALLKPGRNFITFFATPPGKEQEQRFHWDQGGPVVVQVVHPAPQWQRHLFNGLAQVIVQSEAQPGEILLTASSVGLAPATLTIHTQ
jgi:beta-galactosidase